MSVASCCGLSAKTCLNLLVKSPGGAAQRNASTLMKCAVAYRNELNVRLFRRQVGWSSRWVHGRRWLSSQLGNTGSGTDSNKADGTQIKGIAENFQSELKNVRPEARSEQQEKEEKAKADAFSKRMMNYSFMFFGVMFTGSVVFVIAEWGAPQKAEDGTELKDEFSDMNVIKQYVLRTHRELLHYDKLIKEPSRQKLLPDPLTEPYFQPPYTLVLEMTGVLVHPDWTYQTGWRFKKRPGVDFFLQQVGPPLFEVVIYTAEQGFTAFPIIDSLDPNGHIMYRLFRDATRYVNGHHVKDLSCLNRDLSKVIMVDWNDKSVQMNKENSLVIKKWKGEDLNTQLMDLAIFLRTIAGNEVDDVRPVLQFYSQFDDPIYAFKENQRRLSEENEEKAKQVQSQNPSLVQSWTSSHIRRK